MDRASNRGAEMIDVRSAAALVRRHPETVRRWVWSGRLAAQRHGNRLLMARADVEALAASDGRALTSLAAWAERTRAARGVNGTERLGVECGRARARGSRAALAPGPGPCRSLTPASSSDWIAPDADPELPALAALERLAAAEAELLAPRLLVKEVSNALLTGVRRERWSGQAADAAQGLLGELPVRLVDEPRDLDRAWDLARRYDHHPIYDLLYVALAERRRTQLVTADAALRQRLGELDWVLAPEQVLR